MHHHYSTLIIVLLQKEIDLLLRADSIKLYLYNIVLSAAPIYYLFIISRLLSEEEELKPSLNSSASLPYLSSSLATSEKHSSNTLCFVGLLRILVVKKDYTSHNFHRNVHAWCAAHRSLDRKASNSFKSSEFSSFSNKSSLNNGVKSIPLRSL